MGGTDPSAQIKWPESRTRAIENLAFDVEYTEYNHNGFIVDGTLSVSLGVNGPNVESYSTTASSLNVADGNDSHTLIIEVREGVASATVTGTGGSGTSFSNISVLPPNGSVAVDGSSSVGFDKIYDEAKNSAPYSMIPEAYYWQSEALTPFYSILLEEAPPTGSYGQRIAISNEVSIDDAYIVYAEPTENQDQAPVSELYIGVPIVLRDVTYQNELIEAVTTAGTVHVDFTDQNNASHEMNNFRISYTSFPGEEGPYISKVITMNFDMSVQTGNVSEFYVSIDDKEFSGAEDFWAYDSVIILDTYFHMFGRAQFGADAVAAEVGATGRYDQATGQSPESPIAIDIAFDWKKESADTYTITNGTVSLLPGYEFDFTATIKTENNQETLIDSIIEEFSFEGDVFSKEAVGYMNSILGEFSNP